MLRKIKLGFGQKIIAMVVDKMNKIIIHIRNNWDKYLLFLIIILASILRFYRLGDFLHFAHDEGRDALIIKNILDNKEIPLLGPSASIGLFNLGPLYYYFITPFFILYNFNPVGGAVFVALIGIFTVLLLWKVTKEVFSKEAGLFASFLYATSFTVIMFSRWSWNLNPMPLFVLLYIYAFIKLERNKKNKGKWLLIFIISLGVMIQLHASAFIFIPISLILFFIFKIKNITKKEYFFSSAIFLLLNFPFIYYELSNNFISSRKIINTLFDRVGTHNIIMTIYQNVFNFGDLVNALMFSKFYGLEFNLLFINFKNNYSFWGRLPGFILLFILIIFLIYYYLKNRSNHGFKVVTYTALLLFPGFILFKDARYLHYYIIYFPILYFVIGCLLSHLYKKNLISKALVIIFVLLILFINLSSIINYWYSLNSETKPSLSVPLFQMENVVDAIIAKSQNDSKPIIKCEVGGYTPAFEYLFSIKDIDIKCQDDNYQFRIYESSEPNSQYKPLEVEYVIK